jgi:hypothetical protein
MGYTLYADFPVNAIYIGEPTPTSFKIFCPSTNIADAWPIAGKLYQQYDWIGLDKFGDGYRFLIIHDDLNIDGIAETAPLAICLAALKACGVEVKG